MSLNLAIQLSDKPRNTAVDTKLGVSFAREALFSVFQPTFSGKAMLLGRSAVDKHQFVPVIASGFGIPLQGDASVRG
jgi:hypothetical protein